MTIKSHVHEFLINRATAIEWTAINMAMAVCVVLGVGFNVQWAENLTKFALWLYTIHHLINNTDNGRAAFSKKGRPMIRGVSLAFDIALTLTLAAFGWWFYCTMQIVQTVLYERLYTAPDAPPPDKPKAMLATTINGHSSRRLVFPYVTEEVRKSMRDDLANRRN